RKGTYLWTRIYSFLLLLLLLLLSSQGWRAWEEKPFSTARALLPQRKNDISKSESKVNSTSPFPRPRPHFHVQALFFRGRDDRRGPDSPCLGRGNAVPFLDAACRPFLLKFTPCKLVASKLATPTPGTAPMFTYEGYLQQNYKNYISLVRLAHWYEFTYKAFNSWRVS
ncbi:hypothetical protein THAOC_05991, partial [Thalassiosira oceanica]